eukprot:c13618_g1_i1 orf=83-805(+)
MAMSPITPHHASKPLSALLPPLLHHIAHNNNGLHALLHHIAHLHCSLANAMQDLGRSLGCSFREAVERNPLLLILPPQLYPRPAHKTGGHLRNQCHVLSSYNFAALLPGDSIAAAVVSNGIFNFLNIYNTLLIVRLILTWFPNPPQVIANPLSTICDPYLNIFRGIIPPLGGTLDFSPILAFVVLNVFTNTAAALPAELPLGNSSSTSVNQFPSAAKLTWAQKAWLKRFATFQPEQVKEK